MQQKTYTWHNHLPGSRAFSAVMANPPCTRDSFFLIFARASDQTQPRLGIIASKKVSRHAVDRNRLKRVVREAFRQHLPSLRGLDIVVLAKKAACTTENKKLFQSLDKHWQLVQKHAKYPD